MTIRRYHETKGRVGFLKKLPADNRWGEIVDEENSNTIRFKGKIKNISGFDLATASGGTLCGAPILVTFDNDEGRGKNVRAIGTAVKMKRSC